MASNGLPRPINLDVRSTGDLAVTADWHVPLYDRKLVDAFLEAMAGRAIKQLVIAGDFLHGDALSRFAPKQADANMNREIRESNLVMSELLEQFERVYFICGNHDVRTLRALGYATDFETSMRMSLYRLEEEQQNRLTISPLDHLWVKAGNRKFYVAHPTQYSRTPLSGAIKLAAKVDANVLVGHSHHCAVGYATNGKHLVAELGGFHNPSKTEYLNTTSTFPHHVNGYSVITADGTLELFGAGVTARM